MNEWSTSVIIRKNIIKYNNLKYFGLILTLKICLVSNITRAVFFVVVHFLFCELLQADSVKLVHAFMSTRLEHSNALFAGKQLIGILQLIKNTYT